MHIIHTGSSVLSGDLHLSAQHRNLTDTLVCLAKNIEFGIHVSSKKG